MENLRDVSTQRAAEFLARASSDVAYAFSDVAASITRTTAAIAQQVESLKLGQRRAQLRRQHVAKARGRNWRHVTA